MPADEAVVSARRDRLGLLAVVDLRQSHYAAASQLPIQPLRSRSIAVTQQFYSRYSRYMAVSYYSCNIAVTSIERYVSKQSRWFAV